MRRSLFRRTLFVLSVLTAALAWPAGAANTDLATGLTGAIGIAADPSGNAVYFVDWNAGALKRILLAPGCDTIAPAPPTCTVETVITGLSHPQDVALDLAHNHAYVTTREGPGTSSGALWRIDVLASTMTLITFNLEAPHQIALDIPANTAYVAAFDGGRLWKIDLVTGSKTTVISGLGHPVGLALTSDRTRAYVTEGTPPRLAEIDVATGTRIRNVVTGLTSPFYLTWTDPAQNALYLVQRDPANDVRRIDVPTGANLSAISALPFRPSAVAVDLFRGAAYVATDSKVVRVGADTLPPADQVFIAVGLVPYNDISADGYATASTSLINVDDAPFGGTLNIFGNLANFHALGATHYRVKVSRDGGPPMPVALSFNVDYYDPATNHTSPRPIAPVPGDDRYEIPPEYASATLIPRWSPPFLMLQWPSGVNGLYTFTVEIWKLSGTTWEDKTPLLTAANNTLALRIDNTQPEVDILKIYKHVIPLSEADAVRACEIVSSPASPSPRYDVRFTAHDPNGHLLDYGVGVLFGDNRSDTVIPAESYAAHRNADGLHLWRGVQNVRGPMAGWPATCNCAHTFIVSARKRTTNGYYNLLSGQSHQSITINNNSAPSCPENVP